MKILDVKSLNQETAEGYTKVQINCVYKSDTQKKLFEFFPVTLYTIFLIQYGNLSTGDLAQ